MLQSQLKPFTLANPEPARQPPLFLALESTEKVLPTLADPRASLLALCEVACPPCLLSGLRAE